jgi:osmoprotectant transport system ATP-binding protein
MDEPFGALDPITRSSLQDEFLEIQEQINTTILFVTHSVDEALKMGDRIAIFDVGELVRYDTPEKILENPGSEFVADFIGEDRALKQLQVTTVRSVMRDEIPTRFTGGSNASDGLVNTNDSLVPVEPSDSAQTALSRIIQAGTDVIPVVKNGDVIGVVSESDIRDHTQMTAQNTEAV